MNTSSRISKTALPAVAPARPKAPRWWRHGWLLAVLAVVALGSSAWASGPPVSFRPPQAVSGPGDGLIIKLIDLNNDGKLDVVVSTFDSTFVTYLGNGNGTFAAGVSTTVTAAAGKVVRIEVRDINGDGKPDVVTITNENTLRVFLGNGDGSFTASSTYPTGTNPTSIAIGDFNRDGFMDVAVSNFGSDTIRIFHGTATPAGGLFPLATQVVFSTPGGPGLAGAMDFNGDGFTDLAWSTSSGLGFLYDSRPPRPVTFQPTAFGQRTSSGAGVLAANGLPSVLVTEILPGRLRVFLYQQVNFNQQTFVTVDNPSSVVVADLNGDGNGDIVVGSQGGGSIEVYRGNGDNTVEAAQYFSVGFTPITVAAGDLDGDGQPDVVVADTASGFKVLLQKYRSQLAINAPTVFINQQGVVTLSVAGVGTSAVPTGNVTLSVDAGAPASAALVNGQASFNLGLLAAGNHTLLASYAEQGAFAASAALGNLTVNPLLATQIAVSAPAVNVGQAGLVTVAVSAVGSSNAVTGNVTLSVDGGAAASAVLVNGEATFNVGSLPYGSRSLAASYAAQGGYLASTGSGTLTVNRLPSFLFLTQSPKVYREQPIFIVASFGVGQGPGGTRPVQCYTDSSLSTPIPPPTNVGTYFATASFAGDATYAPTNLAESFTIAQAATRIDLTIPASSPFSGSPVAATGVVTFVDDTFGTFGVFIDVGTASFPPTFTYYLASDTGFANPLPGPPSSAGSYVVVATLAATANYRAPTPQSAGFTIGLPSLVVTTAVDEDNGNSDPSAGTGTSLREALIYAQSLGGAQTISFASGLAGQTITLTNGWSGSGDASALVVSGNVVIQGQNTTLAVGAGVPRRHFYVASSGALTLQNVTLTGGNCPSGGGAIFSQGLLNVDGCTFTGNTSAQEGGALWNYGAGTQTQVKNSTFEGNTSVQNGGAISTACELMTLTNVTFADNSITGTVGGGIHQYSGVTRLVNSIVARNTANGSPNNVTSIFNPLDAANSFNNLLGADVAGATGSGLTHGVNGNKVGIAAASLGLGTLANNGGLTPTVALLPGSPAVNGGTATGAPATDQRGKLRPQFGVVDIGAFEQTPFDTGQTIVNVGGGFWYLGPDAVGGDLRVYRELPGQLAEWVDGGTASRIGQALDGTVLVENSNGEVYARPGSTTGLGSAWPRLTSVVAGDLATWFLGPDGFGSDAYIYRWASGGAPTYSGGFGTQLSVAPNGAIFARNNAGNDYLRVGSEAGLGSLWQIVNRSLVSWRLLHSLPYDGTQDLANPAADGVANLLKYAFNMAPNIGDLARVNVAELPENGTAGLPFIYRDAQGHLVIEFLRRKAATNPGIACIVETGDTLSALPTLSLSGAAVVSIDATWERVTIADPTITQKRFGRVRVSVAP